MVLGSNRCGRIDHSLEFGQTVANQKQVDFIREHFAHVHVEMEPGARVGWGGVGWGGVGWGGQKGLERRALEGRSLEAPGGVRGLGSMWGAVGVGWGTAGFGG